jgi:hypothetical protein
MYKDMSVDPNSCDGDHWFGSDMGAVMIASTASFRTGPAHRPLNYMQPSRLRASHDED